MRGSSCFVLSGCSGGGKSTLLAALGARGVATVEEAGRRIVREQLGSGGDGLPWRNPARFATLVAAACAAQFELHRNASRAVFFDRGIVEGINYFEQRGLPIPDEITRAARQCRFASKVFMTPPWPEIFVNDDERRHGFEEALAEYESLLPCYEAQGYQVVIVPKGPVAERADFVLHESGADLGGADATA